MSLDTKASIPLIDLSDISLILQDNEINKDKFISLGLSLGRALQTCGFAYLVNHGIRSECVRQCMDQWSNFFALPAETKRRFSRDATHVHGYSAVGREVLRDGDLEAKESFDVHSLSDIEKWPQNDEPSKPDLLRTSTVLLADQVTILAKRILRSIAWDMHNDPETFLGSHSKIFSDGNFTAVRILHYPSIATTSLVDAPLIRCAEHTDYGELTLLFQDETGGLEIQTLDGSWLKAPPIVDAIVMNVGELMQTWSGGRYRATQHRVVADANTKIRARLSIAAFIHPDHETDIRPMTGGRSEGEVTQETSALEHVTKRFMDTYKND